MLNLMLTVVGNLLVLWDLDDMRQCWAHLRRVRLRNLQRTELPFLIIDLSGASGVLGPRV